MAGRFRNVLSVMSYRFGKSPFAVVCVTRLFAKTRKPVTESHIVDCTQRFYVLVTMGMLVHMAEQDKRDRGADSASSTPRDQAPNPVWFKPIMFGFMLVGLLWIITFYVSAGLLPIPGINASNILIGFGLMFVGFLMTTRWR